MTHDELLEAVKDNPTTLAVVELHKPIWIDSDIPSWCAESCGSYPCNTIQVIEKELSVNEETSHCCCKGGAYRYTKKSSFWWPY